MTDTGKRKFVWGLIIVLGVLHWDFWFWSDRTLLFGFLPIGLGYHALFSVCAASAWALAVSWAWPSEIEAWANEPDAGGEEQG